LKFKIGQEIIHKHFLQGMMQLNYLLWDFLRTQLYVQYDFGAAEK
jgi:hypothetical protein